MIVLFALQFFVRMFFALWLYNPVQDPIVWLTVITFPPLRSYYSPLFLLSSSVKNPPFNLRRQRCRTR